MKTIRYRSQGRALSSQKFAMVAPSLWVFFCIFLFSPLHAHAVTQEEFSATLVDFEGPVLLQRQGEEIWLPVEKDIPLEEGDRIKTAEGSSAEILFDDGSLVRVEEKSEMTIRELSADYGTKHLAASVYLWFGRVISNIATFVDARSRFDVHTPTMVAGVRGTEFVVETTDSRQTDVGVFDGQVAVGGIDEAGRLIKESEVLLTRGNQTAVRLNRKPLKPFKLKPKMVSHKPAVEKLKKKALEKRRDLPNIIEKRKKARAEIQEEWKRIRQQKAPKPGKPESGKWKDRKEKSGKKDRIEAKGVKKQAVRDKERSEKDSPGKKPPRHPDTEDDKPGRSR
jgi:hypothetical protein